MQSLMADASLTLMNGFAVLPSTTFPLISFCYITCLLLWSQEDRLISFIFPSLLRWQDHVTALFVAICSLPWTSLPFPSLLKSLTTSFTGTIIGWDAFYKLQGIGRMLIINN